MVRKQGWLVPAVVAGALVGCAFDVGDSRVLISMVEKDGVKTAELFVENPSPVPVLPKSPVGGASPAEARVKGVLQAFVFQSTLPEGLQETMPITVGNKLYLLGGINATGFSTSKILVADIADDGEIGNFQEVSGNNLSLARHFGWVVRVGDYIYVIGGFVGRKERGATDTVERAKVNADGTLGTFAEVSGIKLSAARGGFAFINTGSYLTVTGGHAGSVSGSFASTERAEIYADGSIGSFAPVNTPMVSPRWSMPGVRIDDYFYVLGGEGPTDTGLTSLDTIERATIGKDGALGDFSVMPARLSVPRNRSGYAVLYDKLYLFGGFTGTGFLRTVERGTISADGNLSNFGADSISTLAEGLENGVTIPVSDKAVYYIGGYNFENTGGLAKVQKAPILKETIQ